MYASIYLYYCTIMKSLTVRFLMNLSYNFKNRKRKRKLPLKMKRSPEERHTQTHGSLTEVLTITDVFLDQKKVMYVITR